MILSTLLDLFFPKRCVACGKHGFYLCFSCLSQIKFVKDPVCPLCERPAIGGAAHPGCQKQNSLDGLISVCFYQGPLREAIKRLKYKPWITDLGQILGEIMIKNERLLRLISDKGQWFLIPIPLHPSRERQRGFNQSEILGRLLAEKLKIDFSPALLVRQKRTLPQAELRGTERQQNIRGVFSLNPRINKKIDLRNRSILLIDDVWTTGATLRAGGQILKKSGAKRVWGLTLAR
ncbi:ComF family protein [Candidatus Microgenomates bacterium]|nr:ComF family protein [Candidatus Microgenomates bacterium]